jgi:hypothetical protein
LYLDRIQLSKLRLCWQREERQLRRASLVVGWLSSDLVTVAHLPESVPYELQLIMYAFMVTRGSSPVQQHGKHSLFVQRVMVGVGMEISGWCVCVCTRARTHLIYVTVKEEKVAVFPSTQWSWMFSWTLFRWSRKSVSLLGPCGQMTNVSST